ncbi:MAG: hypothetical protein IPJ03_16235 [Ignavibacteriales bacterium]|nr:hypothetical protein [Ignavibacteriales bacterium]
MREIKIYAIVNARTGEIKYVGKTFDPKLRFLSHLRDNKTLIGRWINKQVEDGYKPQMAILEVTDEANATNVERKHILLNKETVLNIVPLGYSYLGSNLSRYRVAYQRDGWKFSKVYECATAGQARNSFLLEFGEQDTELTVEIENEY